MLPAPCAPHCSRARRCGPTRRARRRHAAFERRSSSRSMVTAWRADADCSICAMSPPGCRDHPAGRLVVARVASRCVRAANGTSNAGGGQLHGCGLADAGLAPVTRATLGTRVPCSMTPWTTTFSPSSIDVPQSVSMMGARLAQARFGPRSTARVGTRHPTGNLAGACAAAPRRRAVRFGGRGWRLRRPAKHGRNLNGTTVSAQRLALERSCTRTGGHHPGVERDTLRFASVLAHRCTTLVPRLRHQSPAFGAARLRFRFGARSPEEHLPHAVEQLGVDRLELGGRRRHPHDPVRAQRHHCRTRRRARRRSRPRRSG